MMHSQIPDMQHGQTNVHSGLFKGLGFHGLGLRDWSLGV